MPTLRQLELFSEAAKDCNFRKTADRLGISQPAVSRQIDALETALGCLLFERRSGATPTLSIEGRNLLSDTREILAANNRMRAATTKKNKQKIIIVLRHFVLENKIRDAVPEFIDRNPDTELEFLVTDDLENILDKIRNGSAHLAIFRGEVPPDTGLTIELLSGTPCALFASPKLAKEFGDDVAGISRAPFVTLPHSRTLNWTMALLKEVGINPTNLVARSQFPSVLAKWVIEGRGMAFLFEEQMVEAVKTGKVVKLGPALRPAQTAIISNGHKGGYSDIIEFLAKALA